MSRREINFPGLVQDSFGTHKLLTVASASGHGQGINVGGLSINHGHTHIRDYPGEPVPEPIWILLKQETVSGNGDKVCGTRLLGVSVKDCFGSTSGSTAGGSRC